LPPCEQWLNSEVSRGDKPVEAVVSHPEPPSYWRPDQRISEPAQLRGSEATKQSRLSFRKPSPGLVLKANAQHSSGLPFATTAKRIQFKAGRCALRTLDFNLLPRLALPKKSMELSASLSVFRSPLTRVARTIAAGPSAAPVAHAIRPGRSESGPPIDRCHWRPDGRTFCAGDPCGRRAAYRGRS
jgi:hypothetical protein